MKRWERVPSSWKIIEVVCSVFRYSCALVHVLLFSTLVHYILLFSPVFYLFYSCMCFMQLHDTLDFAVSIALCHLLFLCITYCCIISCSIQSFNLVLSSTSFKLFSIWITWHEFKVSRYKLLLQQMCLPPWDTKLSSHSLLPHDVCNIQHNQFYLFHQ